ncbi:hypothetical protein [Truepera radiovictrix]|nr:hypothetical protein [Truepera radiovictrix]WMT57466.1 hypothetical protein RCV51_00650 [Truepera radiovictrix]
MRRIEQLDEAQLEQLERGLLEQCEHHANAITPELAEEFQLLEELAAPMSEPDRQAFEASVRRRPLFGGRSLDLEPDV